MGGIDYGRWDAIDSDDETARRPRVVHKQAVRASTAQDLADAAEDARRAQDELARLQARAEELQRKMAAQLREQQARGADEEESEEDEEDEEEEEEAAEGGGEAPVAQEAAGGSSSSTSAAPAPARRRGLDAVRSAEKEREFDARTGEGAVAPDGGRGEAMAAELRTAAAALQEVPLPALPPLPEPGGGSAGEEAAPMGPPPPPGPQKSTLRRLKQLDASLASSIEQECGVCLGKSDAFRLVLETPGSRLRPETKVLLVVAGDQFLCQEPIPEEGPHQESAPADVGAAGASPSPAAAAAEAEEAPAPPTPEAGVEAPPQLPAAGEAASLPPEAAAAGGAEAGTAEAPGGESLVEGREPAAAEGERDDLVEVELRFFRAVPKQGALGRKLGAVPTLHVVVVVGGAVQQSLEFIGVHQRRYCAEESPGDAIAQNLVESLLTVVLEFVFHPSRNRYAKQRLVFRECSGGAAAREDSRTSLLNMVERLKSVNEKIQQVSVQVGPSPGRAHGSKGEKERSFLIFDEDVLRVAPAKPSTARAPSAKGAFKGLGQGFLNTAKAKRCGLSDGRSSDTPTEPPPLVAAAAQDGAPAPAGAATTADGTLEKEAGPPPVQTGAEEKRRLLLGGVDVETDVSSEVRAFQAAAAAGAGSAGAAGSNAAAGGEGAREPEEQDGGEEEEELSAAAQAAGLSALADRLFGSLADAEADEASQAGPEAAATESTATPSPKAASSRDGGDRPPSERSELSATAAVDAEGDAGQQQQPAAGAVGLRLLQQRRRGGAAAPERGPGGGVAAAASAPAAKAEAKPRDESEDLVQLWMKQRW